MNRRSRECEGDADEIDWRISCIDSGSMKVDLPLAEMTVTEKLCAMETLWGDLSRSAPEAAIPDWHADILAERERRLAAGTEVVLDWEEAKRRLRREIDESQDS